MDFGQQKPTSPHLETETVELLFRVFGDVLIPLEAFRQRYYRNLNPQTFAAELNGGRVQIPITTLDPSRKAQKFIHIRHAAALIDTQARL